MSKRAKNEAMEALHAQLAEALAARIADGSATAADLAVAAKFLKDNGVSRLIDPNTKPGSVLTGLKADQIVADEYGDEEFERAVDSFN